MITITLNISNEEDIVEINRIMDLIRSKREKDLDFKNKKKTNGHGGRKKAKNFRFNKINENSYDLITI